MEAMVTPRWVGWCDDPEDQMLSTPKNLNAPCAPAVRASTFGLRDRVFRVGWVQLSLLLTLATPAFLLGAVSGGIYGATVCTLVWLALRLADEDAAWTEHAPEERPTRHRSRTSADA